MDKQNQILAGLNTFYVLYETSPAEVIEIMLSHDTELEALVAVLRSKSMAPYFK